MYRRPAMLVVLLSPSKYRLPIDAVNMAFVDAL